MTEKKTFRNIDRRKIIKNEQKITSIFNEFLDSKLFCNRCGKECLLSMLEINHENYGETRICELVCRKCHEEIDFVWSLPKLSKMIKGQKFPEKCAIFIFQSKSNLIGIYLKNKEIKVIRGFGENLPPKQEMKIIIPEELVAALKP